MTQQAAIYESGLYMKHVTYSLQSRTERYPWFIPTSHWPGEMNNAASSLQELLLAKLRGSLLTECEYHNVKKLCVLSLCDLFQVRMCKSQTENQNPIERLVLFVDSCVLTRRLSVELKSHWNVVHPGSCVNAHKPRTDWWIKCILFDWKLVSVPREDLQEKKATCLEIRGHLLDWLHFLCFFFVFNPEDIQWKTIHYWKGKQLTNTKDYVNCIKKDSVNRHLVAFKWMTFLNWSFFNQS